jgi:hypothetical protein
LLLPQRVDLARGLADAPRDRVSRAPSGTCDCGYRRTFETLVEGAMKQQRLLVLAPRDVRAGELEEIIRESAQNW